MADDFEEWIAQQMLDILLSTGIEVVYTNDFIPLIEQSFAKMASQKACAASDKNSFH
jgi:BarA-like signal transduction histidine kinase